MDKVAFKEFVVEIVRRIDADPGFKALPWRWVVDRPLGLLPSSGPQHFNVQRRLISERAHRTFRA
jgi:hypothetical protein